MTKWKRSWQLNLLAQFSISIKWPIITSRKVKIQDSALAESGIFLWHVLVGFRYKSLVASH